MSLSPIEKTINELRGQLDPERREKLCDLLRAMFDEIQGAWDECEKQNVALRSKL